MLLTKCIASLSGDSCTPDAVSSIVVQINAAVSTGITQLQAIGKVDLTGLDLTNLCATIYGLLTASGLNPSFILLLNLLFNYSLSSRF